MAFSVKDEATDLAVRKLAALKGKGLTDVIREACENEFARTRGSVPLQDRLQALSARYLSFPKRNASNAG